MRAFLIRCFVLLFLFAGPAAWSPAAEPLGFYGFVNAQALPFGFNMEQVAGFSNIIGLEVGRFEDVDDVFDEELGIPRALDLGFHINLGLEAFSLNGQLNPEYFDSQVGLLSLKLQKSGYLDSNAIFSLFIVDEPANHGLTDEDQEIFIEIVNRYFPGHPTMINYSINQLLNPNLTIPEALDIVAFDAYYFRTENTDQSQPALDGFLESAMKQIRIKAPGKPVVFVAQGFEARRAGVKMPTREQLEWQVEYCLRSPEIVGLIWFMYGSSGDLRGSVDFPEQFERQRQIGYRLMPGLIQPLSRR